MDDRNTTQIICHQSESEIQKFYSGKKVFITGGTGFLGKLLVEKLLRSTDVSAIYFLIRAKKDKGIHARLDEYFDDIVFDRLRTETPKYKSKIIGIPGDCALAGLGMSIEDTQLLIDNVEIVFHVAATVNFTEKLKLAYSTNVKGTEFIISLSRQIRNLKACVHISSVYAQCQVNEIDEVFYDTPVNIRDLGTVLDKLDEDSIERYTPKFIGRWPNTYTFTKALAETLIKEEGIGLPIGIFRPAIVVSTYKEPLESWIDNMYGPTGVCAGAASGLIRTIHCKLEAAANIIPADTCVASMIVSAWDVANRFDNNNKPEIPIYNYVSSPENPITWGEFLLLNKMWGALCPPSNISWSLCFDSSENWMIFNAKKIVYHFIPGILMDAYSICLGQKPRAVKLYSKVHKFLDVIGFFANNEWKCNNMNVIKMWNKMNDIDRELFPFSMTTVHWTAFFKTYMLGIRRYLLKDTDQTLAEAKSRAARFNMIHYGVQIILYFLFCNILGNLFRL